MWNVRMRSSKKVSGKTRRDMHISGAEGLYDEADITMAAGDYIKRAVGHSRGMPDTIVITIEKIKTRPSKAALLDISEEPCGDPRSAWKTICGYISRLGISEQALASAGKVLFSRRSMRGAALISACSGARLDPDRDRGVRVSRLGSATPANRTDKGLSAGIKSGAATVREALTLASKVASCRAVLAEICVSDDPDYATGYVSSRVFGYVRIPNIKKMGVPCGGRVFFVREGADVEKIIRYLEKTAVLVEDRKACRKISSS
jgi:6-carboxyhexanoate--CoA ligase